MSLTSGRGPLSADRAGWFVPGVPEAVVYVEPFPRRVRAQRSGHTVLDTEEVLLVHRAGAPPAYLFPAAAVAGSGLESAPEPAAPGYVQVPWPAADAWYEEEQQVLLHPTNPYHRVDCLESSRRLRVTVADVVLVDTTDTVAVYETALAPRLYVRPDLVRTDLLVRSDRTTVCPYKGTASYWSVQVGDVHVGEAAWSYENPCAESARLRGFLCFDDAKVTVSAAFPTGSRPGGDMADRAGL